MTTPPVRLALVLGDLHAGSTLAVCPPEEPLWDGGAYLHNPVQAWIWEQWLAFDRWWTDLRDGSPYAFIHNGDAVEGVHHGTQEVITQMRDRHAALACRLLGPFAVSAVQTFMVRGTQAHVGYADESHIGRAIGAVRVDGTDAYSAQQWRLNIHGCPCSFKHHIPSTSRRQLEASQLSIQLGEEQGQCSRAGHPIPAVVCRGHRHVPGQYTDGRGMCVVGPAWQVLTGYAHKVVPSAVPTVGGYVLDWRDKARGELPEVRWWLRSPDPVPEIQL